MCSVAHSCPVLCSSMDCSSPSGSPVQWNFPGKNSGVGCHFLLQGTTGDPPRVPVVKNLPPNAGDVGSIPGRGTKIAHAVEQLSPWGPSTEPTCCKLQSQCALESGRRSEKSHLLQ